MELQNRLKINNMEAKLFTLKIESLQSENRRLEAQLADYSKVVADLDAARAKIKLLRKKLRFDAEQNKEQILTLQQRVTRLQDEEHKAVASDLDIQLKLQRLKDLEEAAEELRKSNYSLRLENSDLAQRLESTQILANSVLEDQETEVLKEESHRLRQENEDLAKEIEQLQADRWGLVKQVARDLSKTLSPKSEEKAKQLILEYANKEGLGEKGINFMDFDSDKWSSSQASYLTDSGEGDESSADNSSANKTNTSSKTKIFSKLRRLLRGKDSHHHSKGSLLETTTLVEDTVGTHSSDSPRCSSGISTGIDAGTDGHGDRLRTLSLGSSSSDLHRLRSVKFEDTKDLKHIRRNSDEGSPYAYKSIVSGRSSTTDSQENQLLRDSETIQRSELLKYAEALRDSHGRTPKFSKRTTSYSSF
ncbi:hypothetical protein F0562_022880 [Nyssa sinensis]|uniref:Uncharacterized protein n=1 Tax=Nyssa sinensis TaxID=561372 RepID=A0A5J5BGH9_9ASTE|nr:hypothetical protein F0562_022880 [Nyssa sinensis]